MENIDIDIDKAILKNIDIDIDIDKENLVNIDIDIDIDKEVFENIDIDKEILENIDIDIDKEILENIDIDKISNRLEFGIPNRAPPRTVGQEAVELICQSERKTQQNATFYL